MEDKAPFFTRLQFLCTHVDSEVKSLKQELSHPPGQKPHKYDEGLGKLKRDVQELKKLSQDIRENLAAFSRFSGYLRDARGLVEEQIAGTEKMEQYCAQYGYVIPPKADTDTSPTTEVTTPAGGEDKESWDSHQKGADSLQVTPELSLPSQMVMQGKVLPLLTPSRKATTTSSNFFPETPIIPGVESSVPRPYMMMEQWLSGPDEGCTLTKDEINSKVPQRYETPAEGKQTEAEESTQNASLADDLHSVPTDSCKGNVPRKITTPTEPSLSTLGTQLLMHTSVIKSACASSFPGVGGCGSSEPHITTPEEPVLYSQHNSLLGAKNSYEENGTPEEPVLHYKENLPLGLEGATQPEEPILSYQENLSFGLKGFLKNEESLEEPVLSYQHNYRNCTDITPKAFTQSSMHRRPKDSKMLTPHMEENEIPISPELSDMTKSILSLISHQAPSHPLKDHQEHTHRQKDHKEYQQSYRELKGLSQPYIELKGLSQPHRELKGLSQPHRELRGLSQPHRDLQGLSQPHRELQGLSQPHRDLQGFSQPHREFQGLSQPHREPQGLSQPHRDFQGLSQPHRDHQGLSQPHRDHQESSQPHRDSHHHTKPASHSHHKPGQSFSVAMNKLNRTRDDENAWSMWATQQHCSSSLADKKDKVTWGKVQGTVDQCLIDDVPPSPQLSDITQKVLGQLRP